VNYSFLMVESKEEVLVKEERWPKVTPAKIPPPIFLWQLAAASVFVFFVSFTYIHTLCLTTTRWSWGHKNEELFCRLLEEERAELYRMFPESLILTPSFLRGENLLLLQHSALGVPTWHTCLVSSFIDAYSYIV
jgi:hypothetical protein